MKRTSQERARSRECREKTENHTYSHSCASHTTMQLTSANLCQIECLGWQMALCPNSGETHWHKASNHLQKLHMRMSRMKQYYLLMYTKNKSGPRMEPWGTPLFTSRILPVSPLSQTHIWRPVRKDSNHCDRELCRPILFNFSSKMAWGTTSKALLK